jgi:hypothetical protein
LTTKIRKWWSESEQQSALTKSCTNNEIYGITVEKACWDAENKEPAFPILDPYSFFPEVGTQSDIQAASVIIHAYAMDAKRVEAQYGATEVDSEDVKSILGREDRENVRPNASIMSQASGIVHDQTKMGVATSTYGADGEALVVECWTRDFSTTQIEVDRDENGNPIYAETLKYPDGIRMITVTNRGEKVLADLPNPNVNFELPVELTSNTYAWGKYPFYYTNSYEDPMCIWGFSAAEQTNALNKEIDSS